MPIVPFVKHVILVSGASPLAMLCLLAGYPGAVLGQPWCPQQGFFSWIILSTGGQFYRGYKRIVNRSIVTSDISMHTGV